MNKKTFVCMVMVVLLTISGCGNTLYRKNIRDYTNVTSIEGLKFELPSDVLENCTMISEIDQDIDYSDGTYLYKNGTDTYILFNINAVVIAVQKGTSFSLSNSENKQESIMNHSVCDIWMSPVKNKIKYKSSKSNDAFKLIADVKGNVSITPELYGKFIGKFVYVEIDGCEYSMFAGIRVNYNGTISEKKKRIISNIAKSMMISSLNESVRETEKD